MASNGLLVALDAAVSALVAYRDAELELETLVRRELGQESADDWRPGEVTAEYLRGFRDGLNAQLGTGSYESLNCMGCGGIGHDDEICT